MLREAVTWLHVNPLRFDLWENINYKNTKYMLETDFNSIGIMLIKSGLRSALRSIVDEAIEAGDRLPEWKVVHKRSRSNRVAYELAQLVKCRRSQKKKKIGEV
jgi:hypothetical protein